MRTSGQYSSILLRRALPERRREFSFRRPASGVAGAFDNAPRWPAYHARGPAAAEPCGTRSSIAPPSRRSNSRGRFPSARRRRPARGSRPSASGRHHAVHLPEFLAPDAWDGHAAIYRPGPLRDQSARGAASTRPQPHHRRADAGGLLRLRAERPGRDAHRAAARPAAVRLGAGSATSIGWCPARDTATPGTTMSMATDWWPSRSTSRRAVSRRRAVDARPRHGRGLWTFTNDGPGDALLFRIDPRLEHWTHEVEGTTPKSAVAGWFQRAPQFWRELPNSAAP